MSRGNTWVNADGLTVGSGRRGAVAVTELDERAVDGELRLTPRQQLHLKANGDLSGVVYDTNGRATTFIIDGVTYNAYYSTFSIIVESSDGLRRVMALDTMGRYASSTSTV
jgi:hypothetical protein